MHIADRSIDRPRAGARRLRLPAGAALFALLLGLPTAAFPATAPSGPVFAFTSKASVPLNATIVSESVAPTGLTAPAAISVSAGEYSLGCTGTFTSVAGSIAVGQKVCVRHMSSNLYKTAKVTTLKIADKSATFTSTTADVLVVPAPKPPTPAIGTPFSLAIGATGGTPPIVYSLANGILPKGLVLGTDGMISGTPTLPGTYSFTVRADDAGGQTASRAFSLVVLDTVPDPFGFLPQANVAPNTVRISNVIVPAGLAADAPISVGTYGEYSLGCTASFTDVAGTIKAGQAVCVRHIAARSAGQTVTTALTIGGVTGTFSSSTASTPFYPLTIGRQGSGSGVVSSPQSALVCGDRCVESYTAGTGVTLVATPTTGDVFVGWSGACSGTGACNVTMDAAKAVMAVFSAPATPASNFTSLWWNPAESGWGVNLNHQGSVLFATLFVYDALGAPLWLVMPNGTRLADGVSFSGTLYRTTGPSFAADPFPPIGPANVTAVGTMLVQFSSQDGAEIVYSVNGITVHKQVQRQVYASRAAVCTGTTDSRAQARNYQDLWWKADESGWGINITHQDNTLFATLFTYDAAGHGLWLVMTEGLRDANGVYVGDLYQTTGPPFYATPFTPINASQMIRVGGMLLAFQDGEHATLQYVVGGVTVTKKITRQVFGTSYPDCAS
ncbi:MAG: putative Ig domain-containing protein [Burkholderiales bacterium]